MSLEELGTPPLVFPCEGADIEFIKGFGNPVLAPDEKPGFAKLY